MLFSWLLWLREERGEAPAGAGEGGRQHFSPRTFEERNHGRWGMWAFRTWVISWKNEFANQRHGSGHISTSIHCSLLSVIFVYTAYAVKTQRLPHMLVANKGKCVLSKGEVTTVRNMSLPIFPNWKGTLASRAVWDIWKRLSAPWGQRRTSGHAGQRCFVWVTLCGQGTIQSFILIHNVTFKPALIFHSQFHLQKSI